jgi:hypothetical protein
MKNCRVRLAAPLRLDKVREISFICPKSLIENIRMMLLQQPPEEEGSLENRYACV